MVALLVAACGSGGAGDDDDVETGGASGGVLPFGDLVAGDGKGWLIERGPLPEVPEVPEGVITGPRQVYRIDQNGRTEALPELPPMRIFDTHASGDRLVVAGARCADGMLRDRCPAVAELAVLDTGAADWRRVEIARGGSFDALGFGIVRSDDDRTRLLMNYGEGGRKDGRFHIAELDPAITEVERWSAAAPADAGGFCTFDGVLYAFTTSGGFMTPVEPGVEPDVFAPVPVSYQVYAYEGGAWRPAANGAFSGQRARRESLRCADDGYLARVADGRTGFLRWTPAGGWVEEPPAATADVTALSILHSGQMAGIRDGQIVLEHAPGDLRPLPGVPAPEKPASGPLLLPPLEVSRTSVVTCEPIIEGNPAVGMSATGYRNCTVVDRP